MNVFYTSDNEAPIRQTLAELISNFDENDGWKFRHSAADMQFELESRGWYDGAHENGHYLVLNLDKLGLEPIPGSEAY